VTGKGLGASQSRLDRPGHPLRGRRHPPQKPHGRPASAYQTKPGSNKM